jgi:hypothetical protein
MIDSPEPPPGRRSRLEDEVLEILIKNDRPPTIGERLQSDVRRQRRNVGHLLANRSSLFSAPFDTGLWLVGCLLLGILAFVFRDISPLLARILAIGCFVIVLIAIVRSFRRPDRHNVKQWRGRDIDISPSSRPLWLDRIIRNQRRPPRSPRK